MLHIASRGLVYWRLLRIGNVQGLSLIAQEVFLVVYLMRYMELLAIWVGFFDTSAKLAKIMCALGGWWGPHGGAAQMQA